MVSVICFTGFVLTFFFWDRLLCNRGSGFDLAILLPYLLRAGMTGERHLIQLCLPFYICTSSSLKAILRWQRTLVQTIPMPADGSCLVRTHGEHVAHSEVGTDAPLSGGPLLLSDALPWQNKLPELSISLLLPLSAFAGCDEWKVWFYTVIPH